MDITVNPYIDGEMVVIQLDPDKGRQIIDLDHGEYVEIIEEEV